jgi:selenocysteine lyase/cysteine desulfurase
MVNELDWEAIRRSFPVTERLAYLNSAGAGPVSRASLDAALEFYQRRWRRATGAGSSGWSGASRARAAIAQLINAEPDEIAFTTNTSTGMNLIIDALEGRGEVISCELEFPVSTIPWMHRSVPVHLLKTEGGELSAEDVVAGMTERTGVICLSQVQYSNGLRLPIAEIGARKGVHAFVVNAAPVGGGL